MITKFDKLEYKANNDVYVGDVNTSLTHILDSTELQLWAQFEDTGLAIDAPVCTRTLPVSCATYAATNKAPLAEQYLDDLQCALGLAPAKTDSVVTAANRVKEAYQIFEQLLHIRFPGWNTSQEIEVRKRSSRSRVSSQPVKYRITSKNTLTHEFDDDFDVVPADRYHKSIESLFQPPLYTNKLERYSSYPDEQSFDDDEFSDDTGSSRSAIGTYKVHQVANVPKTPPSYEKKALQNIQLLKPDKKPVPPLIAYEEIDHQYTQHWTQAKKPVPPLIAYEEIDHQYTQHWTQAKKPAPPFIAYEKIDHQYSHEETDHR